MVVHLHDTNATNAAVVSTWRFQQLALAALPQYATPQGATVLERRPGE